MTPTRKLSRRSFLATVAGTVAAAGAITIVATDAAEAFQGSDSDVSRKREGTGLGLAISRRLAEMHGGTVTLKSRIGEGTTAILWLPPSRLV